MSPTAEVATIILPTLFPELDSEHFFSYSIPEMYQSFDVLPIFKVETVGEVNSDYGSDVYHARMYKVQVMVFIDINKTDIEATNDIMDRGMEENGYTQTYGEDRPHSENPSVHILIRQYTHSRRK